MTKFRFPQAFVESVLTRRQQDVQHAMDIANKCPATHAMCDAAVNENRARLAALQQARPQGNGRSANSIFYVDPKDARLQAQATEMQAMRATIARKDKEINAKDNTISRQGAEIETMKGTIASLRADNKAMDERNTRQQTENGELLRRLMDMQEVNNNAMTMLGSQGTLNDPVFGPITMDTFIDGPLGGASLSGACEYIPAGRYSIEGSSSSRRGSSCSSDGGSSRRSSSQGSCSSDGSSSGRMSWGSSGGSSDNGIGGKAHSLFVRRLSSSTGGGASCPSLSPQRSVVAVSGPAPFTALILATAVPVSSSSDNSPTFGKLPTASQPAALALPSNLKEPVNFDVFTAQLKAAQEALAARRITSSSSSSSSGGSSSSSEAGSGDIRSSSSRGSVEADQGAKEGAPKAFSSKVAGVSNSSSSSSKGHFTKAARGKQAAAANTTRRAAAKKAAAALV